MMKRKRITQIFPWLLPFRVMQRKLFFYTRMRFDNNSYAETIQEEYLPNEFFATNNALYNKDTGFNMVYQENKVFNLKLAAKTLDALLIKPGETFSLWRLVRHADKCLPYKKGLTVINGELCTGLGGGLCQMSNLLFWVLLHTPLTIVERHTHDIKDFPTVLEEKPEGVDATINEGWLDLKVRNDTDITFQIGLSFDDENIRGTIFTDKMLSVTYEIEGKDLSYFRENGTVYEEISIYRREINHVSKDVIAERLLYTNLCEIGYPLPKEIEIMEKGRFGV